MVVPGPRFLPWRSVRVGLEESIHVHVHAPAPCALCLLPSPAATFFLVGKIHFPYPFVDLFPDEDKQAVLFCWTRCSFVDIAVRSRKRKTITENSSVSNDWGQCTDA